MWLNGLAERGYSQSVVRHCFSNIRAITYLAKKQKYLADDPGEDVTMPLTNPVEKPVIAQEQILALLGAIKDPHDFCLLHVGIFCGPRASEVMGLQWKSWIGEALIPHGTAYEGQFYKGRFKSKASKGPIPVPELVQPVLAAWRQVCQDPSPEALMFPTFGRGKRKGTGSSAMGEELPEVADSSDRPKVGDSRILGHLSGDAPHSRNEPTKTRNAQRCPGRAAARQHQDHW